MSSAERARFLEATLDPQIRAEIAIHNGDVGPRLSTWSHRDPVTLFGAGVPRPDAAGRTFIRCSSGWPRP